MITKKTVYSHGREYGTVMDGTDQCLGRDENRSETINLSSTGALKKAHQHRRHVRPL